MKFLTRPAADRTIAIVAAAPFVHSLYVRLTAHQLNIPRACAAIGLLVVIVTTLVRRAPQRVTPNPLWWLLTLLSTYGPLTWTAFAPGGRPIVPNAATDGLAILALLIVLFARLSLGRNIGFVPAQRRIVTTGAYRHVRHPIYAGLFIGWGALVLRLYSPANLAIFLTVYTLTVIKCVVEEGFLRRDPEYAEYLRRVRYRFIPGLV